MGTFFVYIVKSSACLVLFYLFYRLLLSRDTFHRFNRVGLLGLVLAALVIPFFRITVAEPIVMQPAVLDLETLLMMATLVGEPEVEILTPVWIKLLLWIYLGGVGFFLCQFLYSCGHTIRMIRRGTVSRLEKGVQLVITPEATAPFSWMKYIFISPADMEENGKAILTHELAHIRLRHSFDLLLSEICILFHWFNPAIWLLRQELQNIHEYEADEYVLTQGVDAKTYQLLLIKKAVGSQRFTSMANSLNHSSLKKRITMMLKRKSNPWARLKYLCVLPLTAVAVTSFARPEIVHELDKISSVKFNEIIPVSDPQTDKNSKNETSVIELKEAVRFAEEPQKPDTVKKAPVPPQRVIVKDNESAPPPPPHPPVKKKEAEMIIVEDKPGEKTPPPPPPPVPPVKAEAGSKTDDVKVIDAKSLTGTPLTIVGEDNDTIHISSNMFSLRDSKKTPLVVLDGKILEKGTLGKTVKAEDIESMEVLKDASAISLYGEAAENGVVIITTKK